MQPKAIHAFLFLQRKKVPINNRLRITEDSQFNKINQGLHIDFKAFFVYYKAKKRGVDCMRKDGRRFDEVRAVKITKGYLKHPEGSALIEVGDTKVICTATVENRVPPFLRDKGVGWITAEYSMLPRSTGTRNQRESSRGKVGGRTHEIQRLIGRSLRAVTDTSKLGERTIWIDCDVIQADGGTRTASITGAYVALSDALQGLVNDGQLKELPLTDSLAAISVGIVNGEVCLDLDYTEDSIACVDMNFVMTGSGKYIEVQGTAEADPFSDDELQKMRQIAAKGIETLSNIQKEVLNPDGGYSHCYQKSG